MGKKAKKKQSDSVNLLEIGPEDGSDFLEFEDSASQMAKIKVVGVAGGRRQRAQHDGEVGLEWR